MWLVITFQAPYGVLAYEHSDLFPVVRGAEWILRLTSPIPAHFLNWPRSGSQYRLFHGCVEIAVTNNIVSVQPQHWIIYRTKYCFRSLKSALFYGLQQLGVYKINLLSCKLIKHWKLFSSRISQLRNIYRICRWLPDLGQFRRCAGIGDVNLKIHSSPLIQREQIRLVVRKYTVRDLKSDD